MAAYTEESEEDAGEGIVADDLFAYGTPPTRSAMKLVPRAKSTGGKSDGKRSGSGKPNRVSSSKTLDPSTAAARQGRNMTAARRESKGRRQKARQQARFFKEIDTTLEALGIGTAPDPGFNAGGCSLSGLPPSPVSSTLSLTLALSSDAQLAALATPTALSSRAGTPPPGLGAAGSATAGSTAAAEAGVFGMAAGGPGGFNRRVTSDLSLRSISDLNSGCSTPERAPSTAGMAALGLTPQPLGPWVSCTRTMHHDGSCASLLGSTAESAAALGRASPLPTPPLPPRGPQVGAASIPTAPAVASAAAAARDMTPPLTMAFPGQPHPAPVDRRRAAPQVATTATAHSTAVPTGQLQSHQRRVSYEGEGAAAVTERGTREAAAAAPAGPVPYRPTPVRGGWAAVVMSSPPAAVTATAAARGGIGGGAANAASTCSTAAEGLPPSTSAGSRSYGALADRDAFRRQLGSVLVGHGWSVEELQAQVEEVEERAEGLEEEIGALADAAASMEALLHTRLDPQDTDIQATVAGLRFHTRGSGDSWHELSEHVASLDDMYRKVKEVLRKAKPLRSHLAEDPDLLPRLHALALRLLGGLTEAMEALGRVACCGVRGLGLGVCGGGGGGGRQAGEEEVRLGGKTVRRLLDAVDHVTKKISDELGGKTNVEAREMLKKCQEISLELARASIQAAEVAAPGLLGAGSLITHSFAHEKSSQARRLIALWDEAARQTDRIARRYHHQRLSLYGELCDAYEKAGLQALDMTRGSVQGAEDVNTADDATTTEGATSGDDGGDGMSFTSGFEGEARGDVCGGVSVSGGCGGGTTVAWGGAAAGAWGGGGPGLGRQCRGASAEEVEAQACVPSLMQALLNRASEAHRNLRNELALVDGAANSHAGGAADEAAAAAGLSATAAAAALDHLGSGSGSLAAAGMSCELSDEQIEELWGLLDEMQQTFAELCLANLRRTVWLCAGGSGPLPLWALESVRDSAEAALRFIHTHEHSSMALGDMLAVETELAEETQAWLHSTWNDYTTLTRRVVDGLLSVRRQINVRRTVASSMGPVPAGRGSTVIGLARGNTSVYGRGRAVLTAAAAMPPGRQQPAVQVGCGQGYGVFAHGGAAGVPGLIGAEAAAGRQQPPSSPPLPYLNPPSQQQQEQQEGQHQLASVVAGSDPWVSGTTAVAEVIAEAGASIPIAVAAAAAAAPVSVVGGSSSWKDALLAQQAASPIAAADGLARAGQASIDVTGSRPSPQSSIAVAAATASTATAAAGPADMHGKLHTSTSSSRLSLSTPGPNSGTQRRVAAAAAARSAAAVDRAAGGRHGSGGRGRGRLNGRGRSRQRGADDPDGPMPQPPKLPPPPPPVCDSQGDLPPGLDPWPRLRPRVATDAGSACGAADNASDVSSTTAVAAATVTATTVPLAISMPASSRPTSPNLAMGASPPSPSQLQPPTAGGISWASVARGSGGGVTPPTAAAGQRPSTADSTNGGGGSAATRTAALKSPFELAAAAQPAAAVAEAGTQATAVAAGFVSSPFKASGELHHLLRNQPQPPPGAPTAPLLPPHSPAQPGRHGVNLNVDVGSVQDGGPSSFQFATGAAGPSALGRCGGAASAIISTGNSDCSSPVGRGAGGYAISGGGGHRTPRLGSPHGSGSVVLTAAAATCNMVTAAAANGTANGTGPQVNGHAANGANHQHNQNYHQNGTIILPPHQAAIGTVGTAFSAAAPVLQNASSLSTALSLGQDDLGLTRYGSYSLQGVDAFGDRGGGGGAVQEDSALLADPEVAELFRSIARDPFCWIRWQELSHGLRRGLSNMVGLGSIGQVFAGTYLHGEVAIKVIDINRETKYDLRALKAFKHEVDLNKRLNQHPNIVRFIGVCAEYILHAARQAGLLGDGPDPVDGPGAASGPSGHRSKPVSGPPMLAIVMEYCPMGTLFSMIGAAREVHTGTTRDRGTKWVQGTDFLWRWTRRLEVLKGAAAGLEYMHRCDVVHHDFTSYNLLLEEKNGQWITKVCDFNLSRVIARGRPGAALAVPNSGGAWSPRWQSPEYLGGHAYGCPSDVFSFAVVIWEVVTLQRPWDKELELQNARCESIAMINMYKDKKRLVFPEEVQPHLPVQAQLEDLCQRCWREDPQERPSMRQVADELMKLHEVVQEHERQLAAKARAAAAARLPPRGGAAAVPSAAAAASHTQFATNPSPPAALAAVGGSLADAGAPQGQGHVCGPPSPLPAPQEAAAPAAAVIASPPLPAPGPSRPRALVSPFAVAAGPRPSASPGTSPGTSPCPAPGPRLTPVSPFMTAQQNADP